MWTSVLLLATEAMMIQMKLIHTDNKEKTSSRPFYAPRAPSERSAGRRRYRGRQSRWKLLPSSPEVLLSFKNVSPKDLLCAEITESRICVRRRRRRRGRRHTYHQPGTCVMKNRKESHVRILIES